MSMRRSILIFAALLCTSSGGVALTLGDGGAKVLYTSGSGSAYLLFCPLP